MYIVCFKVFKELQGSNSYLNTIQTWPNKTHHFNYLLKKFSFTWERCLLELSKCSFTEGPLNINFLMNFLFLSAQGHLKKFWLKWSDKLRFYSHLNQLALSWLAVLKCSLSAWWVLHMIWRNTVCSSLVECWAHW